VQNCWINQEFDLFLQRKNGGPSPRAVDRARVAGPRWTHDRSMARRRCRARKLTAGWGKRRGAPGVHTDGFGGRFDGEARPTAVKGERQR
jgi:hypothetical protein